MRLLLKWRCFCIGSAPCLGTKIIPICTAPEGRKDQARSTCSVVQWQKNAGRAAPAMALPTHVRGKHIKCVYANRFSFELHRYLRSWVTHQRKSTSSDPRGSSETLFTTPFYLFMPLETLGHCKYLLLIPKSHPVSVIATNLCASTATNPHMKVYQHSGGTSRSIIACPCRTPPMSS